MSLIDFTNLTEPAKVLVDKIAEATGILYEPYRIRRRARAEASAKMIHTKNDIEIEDLKRKAAERISREEMIKQSNIDNVIEKTLPQISSSSNINDIDNDWLLNFFEGVKFVSDESLSTIWANILAEQVSSNGSISKKTINILKDIEKKDAIIFENICKFSLKIRNEKYQPFIFDYENSFYYDYGINFSSLLHLDYMGLIKFDQSGGFTLKDKNKNYILYYFDEKIEFDLSEKITERLPIGKVAFTEAGSQLHRIVNIHKNSKIKDFILSNINKNIDDNEKIAIDNISFNLL